MKESKLPIRNSTAEFLIFTTQAGENTIETRFEDDAIWMSQKMMATLFEVEVNTINYHLKEIYKSQELSETATIRKFRIVQQEDAVKNANTEFEKFRIFQDKIIFLIFA
jgi:hypothetical protein